MNKKQLKTETLTNELKNASLYFTKTGDTPEGDKTQKTSNRDRKGDEKRKPTTTLARGEPRNRSRDGLRDHPRDISRDTSRGYPRELPTRDEIQQFCFSLRDELRVKVQAEVPYRWQEELEDIASRLKVKKLELYRYILGQFLGKTKQKEGRDE